jgi:tetratricopeptide (TPR) repeat protein
LRPGDGNPPWSDGNRPWGDGNRPRPGGIWGNGSNNTNSGNNIVSNSGNTSNIYNNQQSFVSAGNRYGGVNGWGGYGGYRPGYYGSWSSGAWSNWPVYPAVWAGGVGLGALGLAAADNFTYSNPYATNLSETVYNYSQPIPTYIESQPVQTVVINGTADQVPATPGLVDPSAAAPAAQPPEEATTSEDPKIKEATGLYDQARESFKRSDYGAAKKMVDKAIGVLPQDRALHEFRALVLFAERDYSNAAAALYAVLAAGPGWNWDTIKSFYPDTDTYTRQLRALEADARDKPKLVEDRFVLAYHYFVLGQTDAAVKELEVVTRLQPEDKLSAQMLAALKPKPASSDDRPAAAPG